MADQQKLTEAETAFAAFMRRPDVVRTAVAREGLRLLHNILIAQRNTAPGAAHAPPPEPSPDPLYGHQKDSGRTAD